MNSKSLTSLLVRAGHIGSIRVNQLLGIVIALSTPLLALLVGAMLSCILHEENADDDSIADGFARFLPNPNSMFDESVAPLSRVAFLLAIAAVVIILTSLLMYFYYRQIQSSAVTFETALIERLRIQGKELARSRTLSAQQQALTDGLNYHLPRVRSTLTRWWRTYPRHLVQLVACTVLAFLIEPFLAMLAAVAVVLIWLLYRFLDRAGRTGLPVVRERAALQRDEMVSLCLRGPLLESVHDEPSVEHRFKEQMLHYRRDALRSLTSSAWKTPTILLIGGLLLGLLIFVITVQILGRSSDFGVAGALTFGLCCVGAAVSFVRWQRAGRELRMVASAADELDRFLAIPIEELDIEKLDKVDRVSRVAELDHVTVQDSRGRKLLENVSAVFRPGQLIGVIATQPLQAHALAELLIGFGRPVSGRMLVDDRVVTDLRPDSLARCGHWVLPQGAIVPGTLQDNLLSGAPLVDRERLEQVLKSTGLNEIMPALPEGVSTVISPGDDRLSADIPFRIGLARASLSNASLVVIEEPRGLGYDPQAEQQTLEAMQSLISDSRITVVLPQRLNTLRQCDAIIMLHDHRVSGIGTHVNLVRENELYRHLNYLRFNPYQTA